MKFKHTFTPENLLAMKQLKSQYRRGLLSFQQFHNALLSFYN